MEQGTVTMDAWLLLIRSFNKIIDKSPSPSTVKEKLVALREQAKRTSSLTNRQIEGIVERCNNYINDNWGVNSKKEEYIKAQP